MYISYDDRLAKHAYVVCQQLPPKSVSTSDDARDLQRKLGNKLHLKSASGVCRSSRTAVSSLFFSSRSPPLVHRCYRKPRQIAEYSRLIRAIQTRARPRFSRPLGPGIIPEIRYKFIRVYYAGRIAFETALTTFSLSWQLVIINRISSPFRQGERREEKREIDYSSLFLGESWRCLLYSYALAIFMRAH